MSIAVVVVAAGRGERLGADVPKALVDVGGRSLLAHCLERVVALAPAELVVVHPAGALELVRTACADAPEARLVEGGATRAESVARGVAALTVAHDCVAVHDAARAFQPTATMWGAIRAVMGGTDVVAAAPALPVADTLRRVLEVDGHRGSAGVVDRAGVHAVQTPQVVRGDALGVLVEGVATTTVTDDLGLVEAAIADGRLRGRVVLTEGHEDGAKVTHPQDLVAARQRTRRDVAPTPPPTPAVRIGHGVDVHPFADGTRPLVLGGHEVDPVRGLAGHSDADVVAHALVDALLGALGLGDIGERFGVDRPEMAGARSVDLLHAVARDVRGRGWLVANADVTVLAQAPRLRPHRAAVRAGVADAMGVDEDAVSVKFTTTDGLGFVGRVEGVACHAVVLLTR